MRFALRQLAKNPGFTLVALATLALGIGVNTTAFTILNRLLLQSLPFRDAGRLVQIYSTSAHSDYGGQAPGDYFDIRDQNTVFDVVSLYFPSSLWSYAEPGQPPVRCLAVPSTANFFGMIGIDAQIGRTFTEGEQKRFEPLTVISNVFWRNHFASDPKVLGRSLRLNGKMYTIIGVLPVALDDPTLFGGSPDVFPLDPTDINTTVRDKSWYRMAARLKRGVTIQQAQAELNVIAQRIAHDHPKTNTGRGFHAVPYPTNSIGDTGAQVTWLIMALSGVVLLIACVNLANLQLVRTTRRAPEIAIRLALGCTRRRLVGMLLAESVLVSVLGGILGLFVAKWSNTYIASFFGFDMPLDARVIAFTLLVSGVTGAVFGTVPALIAARADVNETLKAGNRGATPGRSRHWFRQGLVVVELGMALALLAGAGFFVSGIYKMTHRDLGWNPDHMIVGYIALDHDHYGEQGDPRSLIFGDRLREELGAIPGVESATISQVALVWGFRTENFTIEGEPVPTGDRAPYAEVDYFSPGFFSTYGVKLLKGRDFNETDRPGNPSVAIISESMAKKFWPGQNAIGKRFGSLDPANPHWTEVIGVMEGFRTAATFFEGEESFEFLRPWAQNTHRFMALSVRTALAPGPLKDAVQKAIAHLNPDLAPSMLATAQETLDQRMAGFAFVRRLLLQISVLGLLLSAVGIYGVVANLAAERTKEIGIRMALGAQPGRLTLMFLGNGMRLVLIGTAAGLLAAFELLNILKKMLPGVPGSDPRVVAYVAVLLMVIALLACWLPAWRATKVSPTAALRAE